MALAGVTPAHFTGVTPAHFTQWVQPWKTHTERLFEPPVAQDLQTTAHGIARNLFLGYFGERPHVARREDGCLT